MGDQILGDPFNPSFRRFMNRQKVCLLGIVILTAPTNDDVALQILWDLLWVQCPFLVRPSVPS